MVAICKAPVHERVLVEALATEVIAMAMRNKAFQTQLLQEVSLVDICKVWNDQAIKGMKAFLQPTFYWRHCLEKSKRSFDLCKKHYDLPANVNLMLYNFASKVNENFVCNSMKDNSAMVYKDEPAMVSYLARIVFCH